MVAYEDYVDRQVRQTARTVRTVDLGMSAVRLVVVVAGVLMVAALVEHWVAPGGLGATQRYAAFACVLAVVGGWAVREAWPLLTRPINPVYAAATIERASPTLKNSLVNLLLLRRSPTGTVHVVRETVERQAAERLAATPIDEPVDARALLRWGYVLAAVVLVGAGYALVSPKNPFASAARVLMPWADIAAPTRVRITGVAPTGGEAILGEEVEVSATVTGLRDGEQPTLVVFGDSAGGPGERLGLRQRGGDEDFAAAWAPVPRADAASTYLRYRIEAGDARSPVYRLALITAPAVTVNELRYDYPAYTGYVDRVAEGIGDIRAIEGSRVTVVAQANLPIESAQIDLRGDGRPDLRMKIDGRRAEGTLQLDLEDDGRTPRAASYVVRFTSRDGRANSDPASYRIEVLPDLPPEASLLAPGEAVRDVAVGDPVVIEAEGRDPDFAVSSLRLRGEKQSGDAFDVELYRAPPDGQGEGRVRRRWTLTPRSVGLKPGDIVTYWVEAKDNREPEGRVGFSERRKLRILGGGEDEPPREPDGQQGPGRPNDRGGNGQPGEQDQQPGASDADATKPENRDQSDQGARGPNAAQGGGRDQQQAEPQQRVDNDTADGAAGSSDPTQNQPGKQPSSPPDRGQPGNGLPGAGEPNSGDPGAGESATGKPATGKPATGESATGESATGESATREPGLDASPGDQQQRSDATGRSGDGVAQQRGGPAPGNRPSSDSAPPPPVSADGDHDGEAFERMRDFFQQQAEQDGGGRLSAEEKPGAPETRQAPAANEQASPGQQQRPDAAPGGTDQPEADTAASDSPAGGRADSTQPRNEAAAQDQRRDGAEAEGGPSEQTAGQPGDASHTSATDRPAAQVQPDRDGPGRDPGAAGTSNDRKQNSGSANSQAGEQAPNDDTALNSPAPREGTGSSGKNQAADQGSGTAGDRGTGETTGRPGEQQPAGDRSGQPAAEQSPEAQPGSGQSRRDGQRGVNGRSDRTGGTSGKNSPQREVQQPRVPQREGAPPDVPQRDAAGQQINGAGGERADPQPGGGDNQRAGDRTRDAEGLGETQEGRPSGGDSPSDQEPAGRGGRRGGDEASPTPQGDSRPNTRPEAGESSDRPGRPGRNGLPSEPGRKTGRGGAARGGEGGDVGGDDPNLQYAREQTDLILQRLSDQVESRRVDPQLLDKLGWTEQDMRRFVERWRSKKRAAQQCGDAGRAELDDALRNIGLKPKTLSGSSRAQKDDLRDLRSGRRTQVPAKWREQMKRYNSRISRGDR